MRYQVEFVADEALPKGVEWAFVRTAEGTYLLVTQSAVNRTPGRCDAMTEAWNTWQAAAGDEAVEPRLVAI